jgi:hypothetical protein
MPGMVPHGSASSEQPSSAPQTPPHQLAEHPCLPRQNLSKQKYEMGSWTGKDHSGASTRIRNECCKCVFIIDQCLIYNLVSASHIYWRGVFCQGEYFGRLQIQLSEAELFIIVYLNECVGQHHHLVPPGDPELCVLIHGWSTRMNRHTCVHIVCDHHHRGGYVLDI